MTPLTRAQREAVAAVYKRSELYMHPDPNYGPTSLPDNYSRYAEQPLTYRQFRKQVHYLPYDPCIMIKWCGMWLGIEANGYTHS